jgi:hypothetical protein
MDIALRTTSSLTTEILAIAGGLSGYQEYQPWADTVGTIFGWTLVCLFLFVLPIFIICRQYSSRVRQGRPLDSYRPVEFNSNLRFLGLPSPTMRERKSSRELEIARSRRWDPRRPYHLARRSYRFCPGCGYDLRATPNQCPECGWVFSSPE